MQSRDSHAQSHTSRALLRLRWAFRLVSQSLIPLLGGLYGRSLAGRKIENQLCGRQFCSHRLKFGRRLLFLSHGTRMLRHHIGNNFEWRLSFCSPLLVRRRFKRCYRLIRDRLVQLAFFL